MDFSPCRYWQLLLICLAGIWSSYGLAQGVQSTDGKIIFQFKPDTLQAGKRIQKVDRVRTLSTRLNMQLDFKSGPSDKMHRLSAPGITAEALAELMTDQGDVLFAVPDRRKQIRRVPNDPRYGEQWLLQAAQPAAIRAEGAWDTTSGSADVVIAVLDTGVRFDHEDLADRLLPGYDFITDPATAADGNGRDPDASDPGDFLTVQDLQGNFQGCGFDIAPWLPTYSTWHGTQVAGVIAASGNNSRGISGVSWAARIVPLRALGKCGGVDSDIIAAMRWGGGLTVPGVPDNPHPARVINMSLGGNSGCSAPYLQTIAELKSVGVLVVAAAGNTGAEVEEPGSCPGVITVAGLRNMGTKAGFSAMGEAVDISAPAGNCSDGGQVPACQFQIPTTTNLGATIPAGNGYSSSSNPTFGTSFSAPLASGTLALMLSVHPGLGPDALAQRVQSSARPHTTAANLPVCPATNPETGQCNCTTTTCGAGALDANAAVLAALPPQALGSASVAGGQVTLDGSSSSASLGRKIVSWQWQQVGGPATVAFTQAQGASTALQGSLPGIYRIALSVTDDAAQTDSAEFDVSLTEPSVVEPGPTPAPIPDEGTKRPRSGGGGQFDLATLVGLLALAAIAYGARQRKNI